MGPSVSLAMHAVGDIYLARRAADTEERYPGTPLAR